MNAFTPAGSSDLCRDDQAELSVVLPLFNESEVVHSVYERLKTIITPLGIGYELLFVDDGSNDGTVEAVLSISHADPTVTIVVLSRHFGKEAALTAGLAQASGRAVIIMDADLQDPPERIPQMLMAWRAGADVVYMRRQPDIDIPVFKRVGARCLQHIFNTIADVGMPEESIDFMLYSQKAVAALSLVVQRKRYMDAMFAWAGFRQKAIAYQRQPRIAGTSKWSLLEFLGLLPRGATHYGDTLLRILMALALLVVMTSLLYTGYATIQAEILGNPAQTHTATMAMQAIVWGGLLFSLGWLGKHIRRMRFDAKRPFYTIRMLERSRSRSPI